MGAPVRFKPGLGAYVVPGSTDPSHGYVGALGVRWDAGTGLHYMRQRWYDPGLGRFLSRDPLPSVTQYEYVANNPVAFLDPLGLQMVGPRWGQRPGRSLTQQEIDANLKGTAIGLGILGAAAAPVAARIAQQLLLAAFLRNPAGTTNTANTAIEILFAPPGPGGRVSVVVGPYATTTVQALQRFAKCSGPRTRLITNLSQAPRAGRALSTAIGSNAEDLAAQASGAHQYVFNVPNALLMELQRTGLAVQSTTNYRGVVGHEIRILPQAVQYVLPFVQK